MGAVAGRRKLGLFESGRAQNPTDSDWTNVYSYYTNDKLSGDGCWGMVTNIYGSTAICGDYIPVDPENKHYVLTASVKTIATNYLGNNGSGHMGFAGYDADLNFIGHHQAFTYTNTNTTLTRAASPGDTSIYIGRGDWYVGGTGHRRSINFYPAGSPYPTVGGYSRFNLYNNAYSTDGITQISGSEWRVDLNIAIPNWGYSLPIGTPLGRTQAGGSYNYALGAPIYPTEWTTYTSGVMHGYVNGAESSGASFRDGTKFIRWLNLRNYNYRTQNQGDSANYLLDNIQLLELPTSAKATRMNGATHLHRRARRLR